MMSSTAGFSARWPSGISSPMPTPTGRLRLPSYVLLVGDGNYDFKNYLGWVRDQFTFRPTWRMSIPGWGKLPVDNRFVAVSGSDILPDLALGRFPVKTPAEAGAMVANTLAYLQNPAPERFEQPVDLRGG